MVLSVRVWKTSLKHGSFIISITPFRVIDTRGATAIGQERAIHFRGLNTISSEAAAVSWGSAMQSTANIGTLTLWPDGVAPDSPSGTFNNRLTACQSAGATAIGKDGSIRFKSNATVHIAFDVDGYWANLPRGYGYMPTDQPTRLLDSRIQHPRPWVPPSKTAPFNLKVAGVTGPNGVTIPSSALAVVCTVTVTA